MVYWTTCLTGISHFMSITYHLTLLGINFGRDEFNVGHNFFKVFDVFNGLG